MKNVPITSASNVFDELQNIKEKTKEVMKDELIKATTLSIN